MNLAVLPRPAADEPDLWPEATFGPLVGPSPVMRALFARLERMAATDATVLIEGETGTGKELVARALHEHSGRTARPFVTVDCGSLPDNLLEAELFGHARGAFTDARAARPGAIEAAQGGTVFLDEIGELPLHMQPRLLRVIEARTVKRLGENRHRAVDVRFILATHRNLEDLVARHTFREDLFFRLAVLTVQVPALRHRLSDIPALAERLLPPHAHRLLTPGLLAELASRHWSGNVRELRNVLERVVVLGPGDGLHPDARPVDPPDAGPPSPPVAACPGGIRADWTGLSLRRFRACALQSLEREYLARLLERHDRHITAAAVEAQIDRSHLHRLIRRHGL
jgi:DNA-binding NtrC family response regulator